MLARRAARSCSPTRHRPFAYAYFFAVFAIASMSMTSCFRLASSACWVATRDSSVCHSCPFFALAYMNMTEPIVNVRLHGRTVFGHQLFPHGSYAAGGAYIQAHACTAQPGAQSSIVDCENHSTYSPRSLFRTGSAIRGMACVIPIGQYHSRSFARFGVYSARVS